MKKSQRRKSEGEKRRDAKPKKKSTKKRWESICEKNQTRKVEITKSGSEYRLATFNGLDETRSVEKTKQRRRERDARRKKRKIKGERDGGYSSIGRAFVCGTKG